MSSGRILMREKRWQLFLVRCQTKATSKQKLPERFSTNGRTWSCKTMLDKIRQPPTVTVTGIFSFIFILIFSISQEITIFLMYKGLLSLPYDFIMPLDNRFFFSFFLFFFWKTLWIFLKSRNGILYVRFNFVGNLFRRNCNLYVEWYL